jgi:hypothetical protein
VTLVPAGSAPHIPYLVYLARGRDVDRPAVIVLLDSDESGNQAYKALGRGPNGKRLIDSAFVLQLGDLPADKIVSTLPNGKVLAIEDLVPLEIAVAAAKRYACDFMTPDQANKVRSLAAEDITLGDHHGTHDALEKAVTKRLEDFHLDKVGFARSVLDVINQEEGLAQAAAVMDSNFRVLFRELSRRQRQAMREITTEKTSAKIKRLRRSFVLDHPMGATREEAALLLEEVEASLDNSVDAEDLKAQIRGVRRSFKLDEELTDPVDDYAAFRNALEVLVYREVNEVQHI